MIQRFFAFIQKSHLISLYISVSSWIQTLILLFLFFLFYSIFFVLQSQSSSNCMTKLHVERRERLNVEKTPGTAWHIKWKSFLVLFDPDHPASETLLPVHKRSTMTNLRKCFMLSLSVCACKELGPHIRAKRGSPALQVYPFMSCASSSRTGASEHRSKPLREITATRSGTKASLSLQ